MADIGETLRQSSADFLLGQDAYFSRLEFKPVGPLDRTLYHGSGHPIDTLEASYASLLEDAPPAGYLTPDQATAAAYAHRTADRLATEQGRRPTPIIYQVRLTEPRTTDLTGLLNFDSLLQPAYLRSRDHGDHLRWLSCLDTLARALQQAHRAGYRAAVILTPAGPDGECARTPEYLSFQPDRNTAITAFRLSADPSSHWQPHDDLDSVLRAIRNSQTKAQGE